MESRNRFGLRAALITLVVIAISPVFAVVVQASLTEREGRLARAEASLRSLVELGAAHQEQLVEGARQTLIAVSNAPPVVAGDAAECVSYLAKLQAQFPDAYGTFGIVDAGGKLTCRPGPAEAVEVVAADRLFFTGAARTGRFSVGEYTVGRISGRPVLGFGLPIFDGEDGSLSGVAYLALDLAQAERNLRKLAIPSDSRLVVADRAGTVLASAGYQASPVGSRLAEGFLTEALAEPRARAGRATGPDGTEWLYALRPLGSSGDGRLFVAGLTSAQEVVGPSAQRLAYQLGALLLITLAGTAAAAVFAERVVLRPMTRQLERLALLRKDERAPELEDRGPKPLLRELAALDDGLEEVARSLSARAVLRDGAMAEMSHQKLVLESVLQSMAEGLLVIDRRGHLLHMNDAAAQILPGVPELNRERQPLQVASADWGYFELDGKTPLPPGSRPGQQAMAGRSLEKFRYLARGRLTGGPDKIIQASARPIHAPQLGHVGAVVVFSDVTAAWRQEQALRDSEHNYRTLFEANPHPMWVVDVQTRRFLTVNDAAVAHYGYAREEFLAMTLDDIRPPEDVPRLQSVLNRLGPQDLRTGNHWRHLRKDGQLIQVEISSHALEYQGHPARMVLAHDVTQRLAAENALRELNETLEQRVAERTRELAVANEELESFSYSVSHDLRAPLQVIDGFSRALMARHAQQLDGQAQHYLARIRDNTRQMSQLIDDLLALARVTRTELAVEPFDLAARARQIIERLQQRQPERAVEVRIDEGMGAVGDPRLVSVVLENLIGNAWKFTGRTPAARIHVGCERSAGGAKVFFVADNGAGFEMAYADKLFKPFQRLHAATDFAGTGIGLATVHRVIVRHGGRVWVEAEPGRGATFKFTLGERSHP